MKLQQAMSACVIQVGTLVFLALALSQLIDIALCSTDYAVT